MGYPSIDEIAVQVKDWVFINDLPEELKCYIANIEKITGVNVAIISTSPDREDTIFKVKI